MESILQGGDEQQQPHFSSSSISQGGDEQQPPHFSSSPPTSPPRGGDQGMREEATRAHPKSATPNFMGKRRMAAAAAQLHQQIQIIQEELEELEILGDSSLVCKELVSTVESVPDALLTVTKGPAVVGWDRWFQGPQGSRGRKRWI